MSTLSRLAHQWVWSAAIGHARVRRVVVLLAALFVAIGATFATGLLATRAHAHMGHDRRLDEPARKKVPPSGPRGRLEVRGNAGPRMVELGPGPSGMTATLEVRNVGDGPLEIYRVGVLIDEHGTRAPAGMGVLAPPGASQPLPPGASRSYTITWRAREARAEQVLAHLSIDSDSAAPGASELDRPALVGLVADARPWWRRRLASALVLLPLLLPLAAALTRSARALDERRLRLLGLAVTAIQGLLAAIALATFSHKLSHDDGNDGLQHLERSALFGDFEWFLGMDGLGVVLAPALSIATFAALAMLKPASKSSRVVVGGAGLLLSAASLALVSQSLALTVASLGAVAILGGAFRLRSLDPGVSLSAARVVLAVPSVVAATSFAVLGHLLARSTHESVRLDGSHAHLALSMPDLARALEHGPTELAASYLGMSATDTLVALATVGATALLLPLPTESRAADGSAPSSVSLATAAASIAGFSALLRFDFWLLGPYAKGALALLGTMGLGMLLAASIAAARAARVSGFASASMLALTGAALVSASACSPQGVLAGGVVVVVAALASSLLQGSAGALEDRLGDDLVVSLRGSLAAAPRLSASIVLGATSLALWPASGGASAGIAALFGIAGRSPLVAGLFALGVATLGLGAMRLLVALRGRPSSTWASNPRLEPFGGKLPDLHRTDVAWALPLIVALLASVLAHRAWPSAAGRTILEWLEPIDPPGPAQVALRVEAVGSTRALG